MGGAVSSKPNEDFDTILQRIYSQNEADFNKDKIMKDAYFDLRDSLHNMVKQCSDNVEITIYVNHILNQPIVIKRGKMENRIRITINGNGEVTHGWTKETWNKTLWDWFYGFFDLIERIVNVFASAVKLAIKLWTNGKLVYDTLQAIREKK